MTNWTKGTVALTKAALKDAGNRKMAFGARNYMKDISPFLGISTPKRRLLCQKAWENLTIPTEKELIQTAKQLYKLPEREYHYAAIELIGKYVDICSLNTLRDIEFFITNKSWWDSVDLLGTKVISPLCLKYPSSRKIINHWSNSKNIWLIRAALQHQRGFKSETDIDYVIKLCQKHVDNQEFFVSKAIGWALRDLCQIRPAVVRKFIKDNPNLPKVALREAKKGLSRV